MTVDKAEPNALEPAIAVIGGSGFYELPGLEQMREVSVETPFGSSDLRVGRFKAPAAVASAALDIDRKVVFLARHGEGHQFLPHEVNARANIYALKMLGVRHIISVSAVGSLRESIAPGDMVFPLQFIDRTASRPRTFFGNGVVAHVAFADPICPVLSDLLASAAEAVDLCPVHRGGTYLCIEGPQFSTRAESELWRQWGADIVGMTNLPEARLAREAEMAYATLALPSDYDCWRDEEEHVTANDAFSTLKKAVNKGRSVLAEALRRLDPKQDSPAHTALDAALVTPKESISAANLQRLEAILARRLNLR